MTRLHAASGFRLAVPHDQVDCASCHDGTEREARRADDCAACHESPHDSQFEEGPFAAFDCPDCHDRKRFAPATFDADAHSRTAFQLTEGHAKPECVDCHFAPAGEPFGHTDFTAVERECFACHDDAHDGRLLATLSELPPASDCEACHTTTFFADGAADNFQHADWTIFALEGAHGEAECEACHERSAKPDALGRRFGRVSELHGSPPDACATCHVNVHVGEMAESAERCEDCHQPTSFDDVDEASFDHEQDTGFELVGTHARAKCAVCHAQRPEPDVNGRAFGLVSETHGKNTTQCVGCHKNPHGDRFRELRHSDSPRGRLGCARCHDQESFHGAVRDGFDHGKWTGFALDGGHGEIECNACHLIPTSGALGQVMGTNCAACHDDSHFGQFGKGEAGRCERCHQSTSTFSTLIFDHQKDSRFALDEQHAELECAACHKPWPLGNGGEAVRYKPLGLECADCHLGEVPR